MRRLPPVRRPDSAPDLRTAVAALPPRQRAVLVLRYYCDLNVEQAADALGCSPGTVKSQTARALAALRRVIDPGHSLTSGGYSGAASAGRRAARGDRQCLSNHCGSYSISRQRPRPPTQATIARSVTDGLARRRRCRRRTLGVAAPLLAATAVLAIALTGVLLAPVSAPAPLAPGQSLPGGPHPVPSLYVSARLAARWPARAVRSGQRAARGVPRYHRQSRLGHQRVLSGDCTLKPGRLACGEYLSDRWLSPPNQWIPRLLVGWPAWLVFQRARDQWATDSSRPTATTCGSRGT